MAAKKKKTTKKKSTSPGSGSPLVAAQSVLDQTLKDDEWRADLDPNSLKESMPHLPMGSIVIDYLIGGKPNANGVAPCPGMPRGRVLNLYGHEASGKTTVALTCAAQTIADGGCVCYIDWENEIVPYYAKALGVPIEDRGKFMLCQPQSLEDGIVIAYTMAKHGVDLVVFDSVGAGIPRKFMEGKLEEVADLGRIGINAAIWSATLPRLKQICKRTNTAIIGISQLREAINTMGYGESTNVQGGRAWKFYTALRMKLQRRSTEKTTEFNPLTNKKDERITGAVVKVKLDKCKVSPQQGNEEIMYIRHGEGIDDYRTIIEVGIAYNVVKKSGAWMEWTDPESQELIKEQGVEKFRARMMSRDGAFQKLYTQILPFLGATVTPVEEDDEEPPPAVDDAELEALLDTVGG